MVHQIANTLPTKKGSLACLPARGPGCSGYLSEKASCIYLEPIRLDPVCLFTYTAEEKRVDVYISSLNSAKRSVPCGCPFFQRKTLTLYPSSGAGVIRLDESFLWIFGICVTQPTGEPVVRLFVSSVELANRVCTCVYGWALLRPAALRESIRFALHNLITFIFGPISFTFLSKSNKLHDPFSRSLSNSLPLCNAQSVVQ